MVEFSKEGKDTACQREWTLILLYKAGIHMVTLAQTWLLSTKSTGPAVQSACEDKVSSAKGRDMADSAMLVVPLHEKWRMSITWQFWMHL